MMTYEEAKAKLEEYSQTHVLKYYDELNDEDKNALLEQIEATDFGALHYVEDRDEMPGRGKITPLGAMELPEIEENREAFTKTGNRSTQPGQGRRCAAGRRHGHEAWIERPEMHV